jgi:flagellar FliL protein
MRTGQNTNMSDAEKADKTEGAPKARKKPKLVLILVVLFVLLAGGGAGAYWMYFHRGTDAAAAAPEPPPEPGVLDLDPFVVNLADESGNRFLRVNMKLLTWDEDQAAELKEDAVLAARVRSAILELLSLQYAAPLVTPEGKEELKKAIAERATETAGEELKVTDVLFVEFVVQ